MRKGWLRALRRRGGWLSLLCAAFVLGPLAPLAEARMDPLRIVTSQIVRPNVVIVLDTSGSMRWRPTDTTTVGADCYQGSSCAPGVTSAVCADGVTACFASNTCPNGSSTCNVGTNKYCADGTACSAAARLCGSFPTATTCRDSTPKCIDGSTCRRLCTDGQTVCNNNNDCPDGTCTGATCRYGGACGTDGSCPQNSCVAGRCVYGGANCSNNSFCRNNYPNNCSNPGTCSNGPGAGASCTTNSQCGRFSCDTNDNNCPSNLSNRTCTYWCNDGTQCSSPQSYCGSSGNISACVQECPDGNTCSSIAHCGAAGACPPASSRMAIAKHVIRELITDTADAVNYGFMSFKQTGYFPYVSGGTVTTSCVEEFWDEAQLKQRGAWDGSSNAPRASFSYNGTTYTLGRTLSDPPTCSTDTSRPNSTYTKKSPKRTVDNDYCGTECGFSGSTWDYKGSYVHYTKTTRTSGTVTTYSQYYGNPCPTGQPCAGMSYYNFPYNYSSGPVDGASGSDSVCNDTYKLDGKLVVDVSLSTDQAVQNQKVSAISAWLANENAGGLVADGSTPVGCTLKSDLTPSSGTYYDAYAYMQHLKDSATDALSSCRRNYVILVTDGEPNGPGDTGCDSAACSTADLAGCTCRAVLAARSLYNLGSTANSRVKTYTVALGAEFSGSSSGVIRARAIMNNIAKAGGTGTAYFAQDEDALSAALRSAVYDAVRGDYSTSPPAVATSTGPTFVGNIALIASTEFPNWNGHLRAYDLVTKSCPTGMTTCTDAQKVPTLLWDAGESLAARNISANPRRVFTSDPNNNNLIPFISDIDSTKPTGGTPNGAAIRALTIGGSPVGFGASDAEADAIIAFTLGVGRSWRLGSFLNSTPVYVGKQIDLKLQGVGGHDQFAATHQTRYKMVYIGGDDGMIHAFYQETGPNGEAPGTEAWAYVPPDLLRSLTQLYVLGGQPADPGSHIYGIASSPKVNDVCDNGCDQESDWETVLAVNEGKGGKHFFVLGVTDPVTTSGAPNFVVKWHSLNNIGSNSQSYSTILGETWSVPAFGYITNGSGATDSLIYFGSGYGTSGTQGQYLALVEPKTGRMYPSGSTIHLGPSSPLVTYSVIADPVVTLDPTWHADAGFVADLEGRIWRLENGTTIGSTPFHQAGADHPYYYSPAAAIEVNPSHDTLLALNDMTFYDPEVNNDTWNNLHVPNLTIIRDRSGSLFDRVDVPITNVCKSGCSGGVCPSGCPKFDRSARPTSSPVLITNTAAGGMLQALFLIYQPANACTLGASGLVVFDIDPNTTPTTITQRAVLDAGTGAAAGIVIGAGQLVVAQSLQGGSGAGSGGGLVSIVAGEPSLSGGSSSGACTRTLGVSEIPDTTQ